MKEIRFHGIGGQGVVTAAEMLAVACAHEEKYVSMFPVFGGERRGAPVYAFVRFDDKPIRQMSQIYEPDCLVILDQRYAKSEATYSGLKGDGIVVLNTSKPVVEKPHQSVEAIGFVDAFASALEEIGKFIPNTVMLGAFARTTGWITLDSILSSLEEYFDGARLQANRNCVLKGFEGTNVITFGGGK